MRIIVQRVKEAKVWINQEIYGEINQGFLLYVGISNQDSQADCDYCVRKIRQMRLFEDDDGKMNRAIDEVGGAILSISQFTLHAKCKKGNRPSFIKAARPERAQQLYEALNKGLRELGLKVETGQFGADMKVESINDGPVTIILDSEED